MSLRHFGFCFIFFVLSACVAVKKYDVAMASNDSRRLVERIDDTRVINMNTLFQKAIVSHGRDYLEAEHKLRQGRISAMDTLYRNRDHQDPIARLIVKCLIPWIQGDAPEYQEVLDYFDSISKKLAKTPVGNPRPIGVSNDLKERFGDRVAEFLVLRLVKQDDWPRWRIIGVLFYLKEQKLVSTTSALIRFVIETKNDEARNFAIEAIRAINDQDIVEKILFERNRLEGIHVHRLWPIELDSLSIPAQN